MYGLISDSSESSLQSVRDKLFSYNRSMHGIAYNSLFSDISHPRTSDAPSRGPCRFVCLRDRFATLDHSFVETSSLIACFFNGIGM